VPGGVQWGEKKRTGSEKGKEGNKARQESSPSNTGGICGGERVGRRSKSIAEFDGGGPGRKMGKRLGLAPERCERSCCAHRKDNGVGADEQKGPKTKTDQGEKKAPKG